MLHRLAKLTLMAMLPMIASLSRAEQFPSEPITMVVPYSAGGSIDTIARDVGTFLGQYFQHSVVVENRPGGSANIGASHVARSKPNGYTLLVSATITMAVAPTLFKSLNYDPLKDLIPVALIAAQPNVLVVKPSLDAKTVGEFITHAKNNPKKLNTGVSAIGGSAHLAAELFMQKTGTELTIIPYKGGKDVIVDLLGGRIDATFAPLPEVLPYVEAGKLRALAVTSKERSALLPDVLPLSQAGLRNYELGNWIGLAAPKGTPDTVVTELNAAIQAALKDTQFQEKLRNFGLDPLPGSVEYFKQFRDGEVKKYRELIKASNINPL